MSAPNENGPLTDSALCTGDPLARALAVLEPMPQSLDRDALMFAAGAAGRDRAAAFWKRVVVGQAAAACLLVGVGLATVDFAPNGNARGTDGGSSFAANPAPAPAPKPMSQVKPIPKPVPAPSSSEDVDDTAKVAKYLQFRANVLALGINALPNPNAPSPNVDVGNLEDSLQLPRGTFAIHGMPAKKPKPDIDE